jgi:anti-sigma B factor antagonist
VTRGEVEGLRRPPVGAVERRNGSVVVHLAGELDLYNAAEVGAALTDAAGAGTERLIVDLAEVSFVDSTALGVLIAAKRELGAGARVVLAAPGEDVRRALEVSGLAGHFDVSGSVEDALAATG